jgi:hypothetical protein
VVQIARDELCDHIEMYTALKKNPSSESNSYKECSVRMVLMPISCVVMSVTMLRVEAETWV